MTTDTRLDNEPIEARLDRSFEQYLQLVDEYDSLMKELSSEMSSGFMSLAQANFSHSSHNGRYGEDYFDSRMRAVRRVCITQARERPPSLKIQKIETREEARAKSRVDVKNEEDLPSVSGEDGLSALPTPPSTRQSSEGPVNLGRSTHGGKIPSQPSPRQEDEVELPSDPLRWFGVLVPPSLRETQSRFVAAVTGPLPKLMAVDLEMRRLEGEIQEMRKQSK